MTDAASPAAQQAAALHARAATIEFALITECDPAVRRVIMARAGMLRAEARELVAREAAAVQYRAVQGARRERDRVFAGLA
jgi:hypothetical protein